jgi:hypothetical protein
MDASIFLDVNLPNAATWFYFSLLLTVALFFKFSRLLSMRNLDLGLIFLPAPGLLLLFEANSGPDRRWGFIWLFVTSIILLARCLFDIVLERRPALRPNLNTSGLLWLAVALFLSLIVIAVREPRAQGGPGRDRPPLPDVVKKESEHLFNQHSDLAAERTLAIVCHFAVVAGLLVIGWRHFHDVHAGAALATFYLLLPYTYFLMPYTGTLGGQWHHVWPAALLTWGVVFYRRPTIAGLLLGVAAASVYHPILIVPVWASFYGSRGGGRFLGAAAAGAGLCFLGLLIRAWIIHGSPTSFADVWPLDVRDWVPWLSPADDAPSFWRGVPWAYRMPVFMLFVVLLLAATFWPSPKNLAHVVALSAALLLGAQLWYADRGGMHVLWYLPLLLLLAFRPNLVTCQAPPIPPETDWLRRVGQLLGRLRLWLVGQPRPPVSTQN